MKPILEIIDNNLENENFTIREICQMAGISRMHLHRKIKQWSGKSISHYIQSLRLERGKMLLQSNAELFVSEVAYKVGFKDPNYFTRLFSKRYGVPPTRIRNLK